MVNTRKKKEPTPVSDDEESDKDQNNESSASEKEEIIKDPAKGGSNKKSKSNKKEVTPEVDATSSSEKEEVRKDPVRGGRRKKKTSDVEEEKKNDESSTNEEELSAAKNSQPTSDDGESAKPSLGIRLVPLNLLLKPEIANPPPKKTARKSRTSKKNSYIELSSDDEDEQISISSTSESEISISSDEPATSKKRGAKKSTKGETSKLSNGGSSNHLFKEPMSPSKIGKKAKNFSLNVNKMPQNVNKLMKCYRVESETSVLSWSESDDFENMIETSKIERGGTGKSTANESSEDSSSARDTEEKKKRGRKPKEDKTPVSNKKSKKIVDVAPTRSRSTRNAAINRKALVDLSESSSSEEFSENEAESLPAKSSSRSNRGRKPTVTSESDDKKSSKSSKNTTKKDGDDEESTEKSKKSSKTDDHGNHKANKRRQQESSSDEEEKESNSRASRSPRRKDNKQASKKGKEEEEKSTEKQKSSPPSKEKAKSGSSSGLKITINLNKSEVVANHESDKEGDVSSSDISDKKDEDVMSVHNSTDTSSKDESSNSESEIKSKKKKKRTTTSEDDEIPEEEKMPIVEEKLRNRNQKFEANKDFNKLKELIKVKKTRQKTPELETQAKEKQDASKKKNQGKENHQRNGSEEKMEVDSVKSQNGGDSEADEKSNSNNSASKATIKRKRIITSSDEEKAEKSKKSDEENSPSKKKRKKTKMASSDSEFDDENEKNSTESEEEKNSSDNSSDEDIGRKRKRRGRKNNESDDSAEKDEEDRELDELEKERKKNKRKRIKKMASSDEEGEDGDKKKNTGRKAIRKIMRNDKLDVSTKEAGKIERERKQRIEERQKMYNQFYDERPEEAKEITKLVLDFDEETKEPLLEVDPALAKKLKPHQANGVKFMWDASFESLERCENEEGSGCILAHCMGLGKTLQVVTLVHTVLKNSEKTNVNRVLVVCPLNTVLNWVNEFNIWLKNLEGFEDFYIYEISKLKQNVDRANKLMEWHNDGGVMIMSYDMFRNLTNETNKALRKKIKESLKTSLVDPGPDLVICDEGHLLKNEKTSISKAMMKVRTLRRIVLTGTPLQNNLKEYYCMVQFVKPNLLGKYQEYLNRFVNPITNGQFTDSSEYDISIMRRRAHVLHKLLDGCVQRRDYGVLSPFLPPKHEYVISVKLTPMQIRLYKYYMENKSKQGADGRKGSILFQDFQNLQRIWTAPKVLRYNSDRYEIEMQRRRDLESEEESIGSIKDFLDDSDSGESTPAEDSDESDDDDGESIHSDEGKKKKKKKKKSVPLPRKTRAMAAAFPSDHEEEEIVQNRNENPTEWWMQICPEEELNTIEHSSKLMLLFSILEKCEAIGDKLLVFSQSLYSLDVIEHFLNYIDEQTQQNENGTFTGSWTLGQDYFRLDGSTPVEQRNAFCKHFNSPDNPKARLFLISTRAGGLGINLVAANRVIIFDVSWNPSHDIQSIFRVYRFGQTKPCYVYRFLALGTMEEKIYERQVTKQAISKRVIDEQQIDRHYNQNDLQELYKYDLEQDDERILPLLPKDRLFAEMLRKYEDIIYKYHEHDTLLENKEEETLDEEERKQAWEEFEAEKTRPQYPNYLPQQMQMGMGHFSQQQRIGPVTSNSIFGIRTDILLKLLSLKARFDNPTMNESQVKHAIPLLMQELYRQMDRGDTTLYEQLQILSSSLEAPTNYGGHFNVNEQRLTQAFSSMPSTSSMMNRNQQPRSLLAQHILRQQQLHMRSQQPRPVPTIQGEVIEID